MPVIRGKSASKVSAIQL